MDQGTTGSGASKSSTGTIAVVGVVLLVIGLLIGYAIGHSGKKTTTDTSMTSMSTAGSTKALALQTTLVTLGVEHMTYTDQAIDAALDGSPNAAQLDTALNTNGTNIGAAVGSVYGTSAQTTFDKVWQLHLDDFVKYAVADSQGNTAAAQAALTDIQNNYTVPLAQFLAKANPNLPEATVQSALEMHIDMTAKMIDDHVQKNYTAEASELDMANTGISNLFSTLAGAIVKQYPTKF